MEGISKPSPLRLAGFLATAGGGLLVALGSLQAWIAVGLKSDTTDSLTTTSPGIDFRAGKVTLALGVIAILAIAALRLVRSLNARRAIAVVVLLAGLAAAGIGLRELTGDRNRFLSAGVHALAQQLHDQIGLPLNDALAQKVRDQLRVEGFVEFKVGLYLVVAGGVVVAAGGLLDLAWVGRRRLEAEGV